MDVQNDSEPIAITDEETRPLLTSDDAIPVAIRAPCMSSITDSIV